jgi:raffinose/stachyose/melibiose transport system substrate-binding protein
MMERFFHEEELPVLRRRKVTVALAGALVAVACACAAGAFGAGTANPPAKPELLGVQAANNSTWNQVFTALTKSYAKIAPGTKFKYDYTEQTQLNQKIQLLAGQNALPLLYNTPANDLLFQLRKKGNVLDVGKEAAKLGVTKDLVPAAVSILKTLYGGKMLSLPTEFNLEGVWYNKKIFADNNVSVPKTWDQLVAAAAKLKAAGVQPFAASGIQGWPITRLVGNYIFSTLGANAMANVIDGKAKLTDPKYVAAAQAVADLGAKGYFGSGVGSLDYTPAEQLFLQGKAAMFYMGSWILGELNDPKQNEIGLANVGFFPFPKVAGGKGPAVIIPMNAGQPSSVNPKKLDAANEKWLKYAMQHYGDVAMRLKGQVTGFKVHALPRNLSSATTMVVNTLATAKNPVLWFEALMSAKATTVSQQDATPLVTGQMSPQDFMAAVQQAISG